MSCAMCSKRPQTPFLVALKQKNLLAWMWLLNLGFTSMVCFVFPPLPEWLYYVFLFGEIFFTGFSVFVFLISLSAFPDFFPFPAKKHSDSRHYLNYVFYVLNHYISVALISIAAQSAIKVH